MMKGWGVARLYPEPGLRHYCDLDLCVAPNQYLPALKALKSLGPLSSYVDLHRALGHHDKLSWKNLLAHSEQVELDDVKVRMLGAEDHLRLLCVHWLRHGAWGPLGLCDIAAALEARPANFDWERSLGPDKKRADWMACTLGLAHQLLGAEVDGTPVAERARHLPQWLVPAVLEQWQTCINPDYRDMALAETLKFSAHTRQTFVRASCSLASSDPRHRRSAWPLQRMAARAVSVGGARAALA